jgi:hypothetical protein
VSVCWDIVCDDCRVCLWVAQGGEMQSFHLYGGGRAEPGEDYSPLAEFLLSHQGHHLRFLSDNDTAFDYAVLVDKPGLHVEE